MIFKCWKLIKTFMNYCANRTRPWPALRTVSCKVLVSNWGMPRGHLYCILGMQWRQRRVILGSSCQAGQWSLEIRAVGLALRSHYSYCLTWPLCFKKKKKFFFFLAVPSLSCDMWDLQSLMWDAGSLVAACELLCHMASSSLTRDRTQAPCTGSMES